MPVFLSLSCIEAGYKVPHADFYEIELDGMIYTTIKDTELLFDALSAETTYAFKIRAVNKDGVSEWNEFKATTKSNPLEFAIRGIKGEITAKDQPGFEIEHLFDFAETGDVWHRSSIFAQIQACAHSYFERGNAA